MSYAAHISRELDSHSTGPVKTSAAADHSAHAAVLKSKSRRKAATSRFGVPSPASEPEPKPPVGVDVRTIPQASNYFVQLSLRLGLDECRVWNARVAGVGSILTATAR